MEKLEAKKTAKVFLTAKDTGDRLSEKESVGFSTKDPEEEGHLVNIYPEVVYQEIEGFGGAFTEAGAVTLNKLSPENRQRVLEAYFCPEKGLGYSLCRTHINSCDFSLGNYSYLVEEGDTELQSFNIDRDKKALIPFIKAAMEVKGAGFNLLASPWSPPAWMKTNGEMNRGGKLKEEYRETWARYYARYIKEYKDEGIKIWGVSVQNEPKATQVWDSCVYTSEEERDFVKYYLGPALEKEELENVKILIWDHNKERIFERAKIALSEPGAARYIWGVGFHWYSGDHFESLSAVHEMFPKHRLIFTEGCQEGGVKLGAWATGERYGHDIIGNLNNWTAGWIDWNMLLDETGGPNHVGNFCDAPIIADTGTDSLFFESSYYYIGHFSKFIRPGAKRICVSKYTDKLEITGFLNPDGTTAVVILNRTEEKLPVNLRNEFGIAHTVSLPRSIMTMVY